jgi:hypothetical protein
MTQFYFPFDQGAGANVTEEQWQKMAKHWLKTGVLSNLLIFADSTGMQVKASVGYAWIEGHYYENDLQITLPIAGANATNPRIDRVVLQLDWTNNVIQLQVLQGVPAVSPEPPALTQNTARWEISLAQVRVDAGVTTIVAGKVTDERTFTGSANEFQPAWTNVITQNGWFHGTGDDGQYFKDSLGIVHLRGKLQPGILTNGTAPFILPSGFRPGRNYDTIAKAGYGGALVVVSVRIDTDGACRLYGSPTIDTLYINDIHFRAEG